MGVAEALSSDPRLALELLLLGLLTGAGGVILALWLYVRGLHDRMFDAIQQRDARDRDLVSTVSSAMSGVRDVMAGFGERMHNVERDIEKMLERQERVVDGLARLDR